MGKETWSLFPSARGGLRRVREAVLVTRQKTPNASTATIAQQTSPNKRTAERTMRARYASRGRWWVARSLRSLRRNDEGGFVGIGGLVNDGPTASPHPTKSFPCSMVGCAVVALVGAK